MKNRLAVIIAIIVGIIFSGARAQNCFCAKISGDRYVIASRKNSTLKIVNRFGVLLKELVLDGRTYGLAILPQDYCAILTSKGLLDIYDLTANCRINVFKDIYILAPKKVIRIIPPGARERPIDKDFGQIFGTEAGNVIYMNKQSGNIELYNLSGSRRDIARMPR